jgi:CHASE2 domain-containing sensor protein
MSEGKKSNKNETPFLKNPDYWLNVGVGLVIFFVCMFAENTRWGEEIQNSAYDALISFENNLQSDNSRIPKGVKKFVGWGQRQETSLFFVDITEREYRDDMKDPLITPRRRIAELIRTAWEKKASVIFLDILLDKADCYDLGGDKELRALLQDMIDKNAETKLIFPAQIGADSVLRAGAFDAIFLAQKKKGRRIFYRTIAEASAPSSDYKNRFFTAYRPAFISQCSKCRPRNIDIIWSVPILGTALLNGKEVELENAKTEIEKAKPVPEKPGNASEQSYYDGHVNPLAKLQLGNDGAVIDVFPVGILEEDGKILLRAGTGGGHEEDHALRIRYLLDEKHLGYRGDKNRIARVEAKNFTKDSLPNSLDGKIVVIGNSSLEAGDIHPTPVGLMAGMYIVGNAINTVNAGLQPKFKRGFQVFIELLGVFIAAFLFLHLTPLLAQVVASTILIIILIPISVLIFLNWAVFINFILPIAGMKLHRIAKNIETAIKDRGRNKENKQ